eukprot:COSAG02_NODE_4344_length_5475_cov_2.278832_2_plen_228_part_00
MEVRAKLRAQTVSTLRIHRGAGPFSRARAQQGFPHHRTTNDAPMSQQHGPESASISTLSQEGFLDDEILLAINIDSIVASASAQQSHSAEAAVLTTQQQMFASGGDSAFLDDSALLAVDLEGLVAAASPSVDLQQQSKTPDQTAKNASHAARTQPRTTLRRAGTLKHVRSDAYCDDGDDVDSDDPDGSIAALFAAERSSVAVAAAAQDGEEHGSKRARAGEDSDEDL